ncbi:Hypothetical protein AT6N2_L0801 [Agrobacterium tumefaciens]|nr:Hypothetical protein AT6N2_L0801 [Agrobacterium tumefaciens]
MKIKLMSGIDQMLRHRAAHDAQSDKSYFHGSILLLICFQPAKTCAGGRRRSIFAADPSFVTKFIQALEDEIVVDLARPRLMTSGIIGDLNVADSVLQALEGRDEIALHDLHVVEVILYQQVGMPDTVHDPFGLIGVGDEISGYVAGVDGLEDKGNSGIRQTSRGVPEIADERVFQNLRIDAGRLNTGQTIDLSASQNFCIADRRFHGRLKFGDPVRQAGNAALACGPVAGRQVEQGLRQIAPPELRCNRLRRLLVGADIFDCRKTIGSGSGKPFHERMFGIKHGQIGGEFRHRE